MTIRIVALHVHRYNDMATDKPQQQQTLSVRIGDALRKRLEALRQQAARNSGQSVSTSEIAKQLLETARDDRLEFADLVTEPTAAMLAIRRKAASQQPLSRAEWTLIAHFVQQGLEAFNETTASHVKRAALVAVLDAFAVLYELRPKGESKREPYYLGNLPDECRPPWPRGTVGVVEATSDVVRETVARTRALLEDPAWPRTPLFIGRNLYVLLDADNLPGPDAVNQALSPFWPTLWRLAARGHFLMTREPVRLPTTRDAAWAEPPIPPLVDCDMSLSVMRIEAGDLSALVSFPGPLGPMYPVSGYPKLAEFRAMLDALGTERQRQWSGEQFFGYMSPATDSSEAAVWFRAPDNGISVGLSLEHWTCLRSLFQQAWEMPDVRRAWDALAFDYGEL
jgi:hypothetical protein